MCFRSKMQERERRGQGGACSGFRGVVRFMESIYASPLRGLSEDKMCWIPNKHKGFRVRDYYKFLVGNTLLGFPWKSIWKQKIPSKVAFFVWTAALGKCLKIDN